MKEAKEARKGISHDEDLNEIGNRVKREMKSLVKFGVLTMIALTILKLWLG